MILIGMEDFPETLMAHVLFYRIEAGRWVTMDSDGELAADNLVGETIVPLVRAAEYPATGRPFRVFGDLSEVVIASMRERARQYAEIMGVLPASTTEESEHSQWIFSDSAFPRFGKEVPGHIMGDPARTRIQASMALVKTDEASGGNRWTSAERILKTDLEEWLSEKREGSGRDRRLLPFHAGKTLPLFREVTTKFTEVPNFNTELFAGPSALAELVKAMAASGLEPQGFSAQWIKSSGISVRSGLANEVTNHIFTIWFLACHDRLDVTQLTAAEHVARRVLQIQRAVRKNPSNPEFDGLEAYMRHSQDPTGLVFTPSFDKHIAEVQKNEAQVLKQFRLTREEEHHVTAQRGKRGNAGNKQKETDT